MLCKVQNNHIHSCMMASESKNIVSLGSPKAGLLRLKERKIDPKIVHLFMSQIGHNTFEGPHAMGRSSGGAGTGG